jgi:dTMP kinase
MAAASMSTLAFASLCIAGFGVCTGTAYVLGFSMLQTEADDDLRGRIFATLYVCTRLCLFLALVVAPFLSTAFDDASQSLLGSKVHVAGATVYLPGVRLTLWLGGLIIVGSGFLVRRGLRARAVADADVVAE